MTDTIAHRAAPTEPDAPTDPRSHLTSEALRATLRLRQEWIWWARGALRDEGFVEMEPPLIGPVTDPGTRGSKQVDVDYFGHRYKLMASAILYKQASLLTFDKIFYVAPNIRLEPPTTAGTGRHLAEFHQLDVEMAKTSWAEAADLLERLVRGAVEHVVAAMPAELEVLGRDPDVFAALSGAFDRIPHPEIVQRLHDLGHRQDGAAEIDWECEEAVARSTDRPFFITRYPKGSRGFYDREDPERPGVLRNFDLLAPEGYGEISSGGERESDYTRLVTRMRETGENPAKYAWYLDLARDGLPASAGFGLGVERFTRYLCGLPSVWRTTAFPKVPGVALP